MYKGITKEYKDKFRMLWFNINDNKNQQLRDKLLLSEVSANILCNMSNAVREIWWHFSLSIFNNTYLRTT